MRLCLGSKSPSDNPHPHSEVLGGSRIHVQIFSFTVDYPNHSPATRVRAGHGILNDNASLFLVPSQGQNLHQCVHVSTHVVRASE